MRVQNGSRGMNKDATFGQRRNGPSKAAPRSNPNDGEVELSWVPSSSSQNAGAQSQHKRKGVETFGAGLERGGEPMAEVAEHDRKGRTQRRQGVRSGSKNVFRRM